MKRSEKAALIGEMLDEMYPETPIPLDHVDPYTLLVAVMLSAQTTDKKVNEVTPGLFSAASTPQEMMKLDVEDIHQLIRQIGLAPTKARNLSRMAQQIVEGGGEVIPDWDFLESLAGVGHKTASVVMSQAFGQPAFPVDTHIHRLASRWGLSDGRSVEKTERDLKAVFPRKPGIGGTCRLSTSEGSIVQLGDTIFFSVQYVRGRQQRRGRGRRGKDGEGGIPGEDIVFFI